MKLKLIFIGLLLILVSAHIATAEPIIIRADQTKDCLDYSLEYQVSNPEWGILLISDNYWFRGLGHYVNYQIDENKDLHIHDEMYNLDWSGRGWQYSGEYSFTYSHKYYHFFVNGNEPQRRVGFMKPNAMEVYNALP